MAGEGIRDYDRIRPVLESIYTYGFFSREDFERSKIVKKSSYDKELQRLRRIFGGSLLYRDVGKRRYFYVKRNYFSNRAPWLSASYYLHSIKPDQICLMLLALCQAPAPQADIQRLAEQLPNASEHELTSTIWRQLKQLEALGYIRKERKRYHLPADPLQTLSDGELAALYQMTDYFACIYFPRAPGEFLRRTVLRELLFRGMAVPPESFLFRENCCRGILDEHAAFQLADMCQRRSVVRLEYKRKAQHILPLCLKADVRMGRWFVQGVDADTGRPVRRQLLYGQRLHTTKLPAPSASDVSAAEEALSYTHLSTSEAEPVLVEALLLMEEGSGTLKRFQREIFIGRVEKRADGFYYSAMVRDPVELKPLLRSYYLNLRLCPGKHDLDRELREELERMRQQYGTVS